MNLINCQFTNSWQQASYGNNFCKLNPSNDESSSLISKGLGREYILFPPAFLRVLAEVRLIAPDFFENRRTNRPDSGHTTTSFIWPHRFTTIYNLIHLTLGNSRIFAENCWKCFWIAFLLCNNEYFHVQPQHILKFSCLPSSKIISSNACQNLRECSASYGVKTLWNWNQSRVRHKFDNSSRRVFPQDGLQWLWTTANR